MVSVMQQVRLRSGQLHASATPLEPCIHDTHEKQLDEKPSQTHKAATLWTANTLSRVKFRGIPGSQCRNRRSTSKAWGSTSCAWCIGSMAVPAAGPAGPAGPAGATLIMETTSETSDGRTKRIDAYHRFDACHRIGGSRLTIQMKNPFRSSPARPLS